MLDFFLKPLEAPFVQQALAEIAVLSVVVGVIGVYVVLRGLSFFSLALSHAIFPAVVVAYITGFSYLPLSLLAGAFLSVVIGLISQNRQVGNESAIGALYTGVFAVGIVLISQSRSNKQLSEILFGRLFAVGWEDVITGALVGGAVLLIMLAIRKEFLLVSFDRNLGKALGLPATWLDLLFFILLSVTVIIALPAVGNIQIIALLVTPPATARLLTDRFWKMALLSVLISLLGGISGIYLAYHLDLVPGASVVVTLTALFLVTLLASPRHGLIAGWFSRRRLSAE
jgi:manganese/iron transport system permease protein